MICLKINFPAGRYHATPWGRHVNEGDVAWPPEPYRILRALIATWHHKADQAAFPIGRLSDLIDALSEFAPVFHLPNAVHAHTRHYMPQAKAGDTKLVLDAFMRIDPETPLIVGWEVDLGKDAFALLERLAASITYFGRAESIAVVEAVRHWPDAFTFNARPRSAAPADASQDERDPVDVLLPVKASDWHQRREGLLSLNNDSPKSKSRKDFEATIPKLLMDALSVETSEIQAAKWSAPPAGRLVLYDRPPFGPLPRGRSSDYRRSRQNQPTVARYVLAGKPRPSVFETVRIAEVMRLAAMSKWRGQPVPELISGKSLDGLALRSAEHAHAFWLPEDADGDGLIDHVLVSIKGGIDAELQAKLSRLTHLWIEHGAPNEEGERGRKEWRLALEGFGQPKDFVEACKLLKASNTWRSVTPYLRPRFGPATWSETAEQIARELSMRGFPNPETVAPLNDFSRPRIPTRPETDSPAIKFRRTRSRRGLRQPDGAGTAVRISFPQEVEGPLSLGYGAHFGLGLFVPDA